MPIKESDLDRKWYYRALKVALILLPLLVLLLLLLRRDGVVCSIAPFGVPDTTTLVLIIIVLVLYYPFLRLLRWAVLYLLYGGIEHDTRRAAGVPSAPAKAIPLVIVAVFVILMALVQLGYITLPALDIGAVPTPSPSCPATSAQTATPCGAVRGGVGTSGIIVPARCACPGDTTYASMDNVTAGGPYKICVCN